MKEATDGSRVVCFGRRRDRGRVPDQGQPGLCRPPRPHPGVREDGQKRYATEFVADKLILLGRGVGWRLRREEAQAEAYHGQARWRFLSDMADDIPF